MRMLSQVRLFQAAAVAAGIVAISTTQALAWGHRGGSSSSASYGSYGSSSSASYGSYGSSSSASYGSYGSSSSASYGSYGSSGSSGSSGGGLFAKWHAEKAARRAASSGSSASYGGYYDYSYSSSSSGSSGGYGSSGSSGGYYSAPTEYYGAPASATPGVPTEPQPAAPETSASIRVNVPADAVVFVNDRATTSVGGDRSFVSHGLSGGHTYAYQLRVEFTRDGQKVTENKLVKLQAGQTVDLKFGEGQQQVASKEAASTEVTLHVPSNATVTLAGAATQQTGETRTFATNSLTEGQEWNGYVVRVEMQQNGKTVVQEKTLSIVGGKTYDLSFDFAGDAAHVASLN